MNLISVQMLDIDIDIASDAVSRCAQPLSGNEDARSTCPKFIFVKKEHQYDDFLEKHNDKS